MAQIYLDYAAATPLDKRVLAAMQPFLTDNFYNPSATYLAAQAVRHDLSGARAKVAHWLGAKPSEIIFTAGGTEANNLAVRGVMSQFPKANVVTSGVEHESVLAPAGQNEHRIAKTLASGQVDLKDLEKKIDENTVLVSVMYANNEVGTIQPVRKVAEIVAKIHDSRLRSRDSLPLYLHTDACQAANYLDLHTARLGVDLMTINGGKIYGPKQSGALFVKAGVTLQPLIAGGGQERNLRSGTENIASVVGLAEALDIVQKDRKTETERLHKIQQRFIKLVEAKIPEATINGSLKQRLPNNLHLTIPGKDNERLLFELDEAGIQAAAGSACSASNEEPSHVLRAMGLGKEQAQASLRFTMGRQTTAEMIDKVAATLAELAKK